MTTILRELGEMVLVEDAAGQRWTRRADLIPTRDDPRINGADDPDLPSWVGAIRDYQWRAVEEIVEKFDSGLKVVWLDAPVGSGKSLIAELVRRMLKTRAVYTCSTKTLQDQILSDFDYARVLKGRSNYPTQLADFPEVTCADCTRNGDSCAWCGDVGTCEYTVAKNRAKVARLAVVNTSYLLAEMSTGTNSAFRNSPFVVLDECDLLERELMSVVEFSIGYRVLQKLKLTEPKKGSHWPTIVAWLDGELRAAVEREVRRLSGTKSMFGDVKQVRELMAMQRLKRKVEEVVKIHREMEEAGESVDGGEGDGGDESAVWVRDNGAGPLTLKPVTVRAFGEQKLWRHGERFLGMSGTIVSAELMSRDLGLGDGDWGVVSVPMTFAVENRRIWQIPVANMVQKEKAEEWPKMREGVRGVVDRHKGERVLVHAVSYELAAYLVDGLMVDGGVRNADGSKREIVTYRAAGQRDDAVLRFRSADGGVLVAPSMDRGVDFKGDDCRVVIVTKVPYPYLGDVQVGRRMRLRDGQMWYGIEAVRTLVQMTGRGVRGSDDWCVSYVLDKQFSSNLLKRNRRALPAWWLDALGFIRYRDL